MKVPELRHRILFTLAMIVVVRLGVQIPLPGIDVMELQKVIEASANASGPGAGLATVLTIFPAAACSSAAFLRWASCPTSPLPS